MASMPDLTRMYENGEGRTKPDRLPSSLWFFIAGERGNKGTSVDARRIRSSMPEKEWEDAQKKLPLNVDKNAVDDILRGPSSPSPPPTL
ncbi:MAG: hypothetical protein ABSD75_02475 [Terriglobales bacterium]